LDSAPYFNPTMDINDIVFVPSTDEEIPFVRDLNKTLDVFRSHFGESTESVIDYSNIKTSLKKFLRRKSKRC